MELTTRKRSVVVIVNYVLMVLLWGSFPVAAKIGVEHAPPLLISGLRFSIAFLIMVPLAYWQNKKGRIPKGGEGCGFPGGSTCAYWSSRC